MRGVVGGQGRDLPGKMKCEAALKNVFADAVWGRTASSA